MADENSCCKFDRIMLYLKSNMMGSDFTGETTISWFKGNPSQDVIVKKRENTEKYVF